MTAQTTPGSTRAQVTHDLNRVLQTLQDNPALARALTDPGAGAQAKAGLIDRVFTSLGSASRDLLKEGLGKSWSSTRALLSWVETSAVNSAWRWAQDDSVLEESIDEVFSFGQLMLTDHELRASVTDRRAPVSARQDLVTNLLAPTMNPPAVEISAAAVASRRGTIDDVIQAFVELGASLAGGKLAIVTVAKPMSPDQKVELAAALQDRMGTRIIIEEVVDPAVLGGVRVECGAEVIDSTLTARLETARRNFA